MAYMRIDQIMIKMMLNNQAVGQYAAAVKLSEAWYFIPIVITQSLFPAILSAKKHSEELYNTRLQQLYDIMVWMAICVALPTTLLSDWVITFLYGPDFSQAGIVLAVHIWAGVFVFLGVAGGNWLLAENMQMFGLIPTGLGAIINIVLNLIFIPRWGIPGSAIATLISHMIAAYLGYGFTKKTFKNFHSCKPELFFGHTG